MAQQSFIVKKRPTLNGDLVANVVFVFPLCKVTLDLKEELEKNEEYTVYEVETAAEYLQLLGILDSSFTFFTDLPKASSCLEMTKSISVQKNHHQILVYKTSPSGLVLSRMEKHGLNESLPEFISMKNLMQKLTLFYKHVHLSDGSVIKSGTKNVIDTKTQMRVERLVSEKEIITADLVVKNEMTDMDLSLNLKAAGVYNLEGRFKESTTNNKSEKSTSSDPSVLKNQSDYVGGLNNDPPALNESEKDAKISDELSAFKVSYVDDELVLLPEVEFFQRTAGYDAIAFYMEILFQEHDQDFKRKFIRMSLSKVHQCQIYLANSQGSWDDLAPEKLKAIDPRVFKSPSWDEEGRGEYENILIFPVLAEDTYQGAVAVITGKVSREKMTELEFWCYLGRPLWI